MDPFNHELSAPMKVYLGLADGFCGYATIKYALEKDLLNSSINGLCLIVTHSVVSFLTLYRKRRALEEDL